MRVLGIDEAGRGSVIGSMFISGVVGEQSFFEEHSFPDSKELSASERTELYDVIKGNCETISLSATPKLIDENNNLDYLEWKVMDSILLTFEFDKAFIDVVGSQEEQNQFFINESSIVDEDINIEKDSDKKFDVVGASSIIAKEDRDSHIESLKEIHGDLGSGYPSDQKTRGWIKNNINDLPDECVRRSWSTIDKIKQEV